MQHFGLGAKRHWTNEGGSNFEGKQDLRFKTMVHDWRADRGSEGRHDGIDPKANVERKQDGGARRMGQEKRPNGGAKVKTWWNQTGC
jgi:hypothetical protein